MIKRDELTNPDSCMNRARADEWIFVLLGRDVAAPAAIRAWAAERVRLGKNQFCDSQITEAEACAGKMAEESDASVDAFRDPRSESKKPMQEILFWLGNLRDEAAGIAAANPRAEWAKYRAEMAGAVLELLKVSAPNSISSPAQSWGAENGGRNRGLREPGEATCRGCKAGLPLVKILAGWAHFSAGIDGQLGTLTGCKNHAALKSLEEATR